MGEVHKSFFLKARGTYRFVFALGFRWTRHVRGPELQTILTTH